MTVTVVAQRLAEAMKARDVDQRELADLAGCSQGAISQILLGNVQRSRFLPDIAAALKVDIHWLRGETDDPAAPADLQDGSRDFRGFTAELASTYHDENLVQVREIDLSFGMGASYLDVPVTSHVRQFSREWLRQYTSADPEHLFFAQGIGNSMEPYIHSQDLLLIDTSQQTVRMTDQIWAVAYGNCGAVRRLRPMADGSVKMLCDNPSVPDETAYDGELHVLGRVVAIVRKI